ncbi:AAA family ATPase [Oscillibacter ruminantium]|uniref:AAA family ATPase n=1 Tax=Oscillibacter ruminantium TaxID=1263547 RepID=UPI0002FC0E67|nr:AAA family ATPase [Oscillibacter ruminantium]
MATAIESMTGIRIKSDFFNSSTDMPIFPVHSKPSKCNRVALLYGKNGSGKSTIAQGFREYCSPSVSPASPAIELKPIVDISDIKITTSEHTIGDREKFWVYDEKYVEEKIKIEGSGLGSIVLFGEQIELAQQIETVDAEIEQLREQESAQHIECEKYTRSANVTSPAYWMAQITSILRQKSGWAETDSKIKGNKTNSTVNEILIDRIGVIIPTGTEDEVKAEFDNHYALFISTSQSSDQLRHASQIPIEINLEADSQSLLSQVVQRPSLTQRECELLSIFNVGGITSARTFLSNSSNIVCPNCLQTISDDYRTEILQHITNILNREVEDFQAKLKKLLQSTVDIANYQCYSVLNPTTFSMTQNMILAYNKAIEAHNNIIQQKTDNPFEPLNYDISSIGLNKAFEALTLAITTLNAEIEPYNNTIQKREDTEKALLKLNDMLAHYTILDNYTQLQAQRKAKAEADALLKSIKDKKSVKEREKIQLDSLRKNFQIAADKINQSLEYIFFSKDRLSLELGADQLYHLKVNGHPVEPSKVSCGERNALALCYFFTEISRNMDATTIYSDEVFLVIDDPVSSFDIENRIGILSFLRWRLEQVLESCATTKVFIMTHDISVVFDLEKALQEISRHCEQNSVNAEFNIYHLDNKKVVPFSYKKHNEYTQLLCRVYQYATNTSDNDLDLVIGNVMRRVLEAFASFSYKKGIEDVSLDQGVLDTLSDETSKNYYRNLMYRLVLNGESHFCENIQSAPETFFFTHLSKEEKQRTAKDILCFIYRLNRPHILAHLASFADAETNLQHWSSNICTFIKQVNAENSTAAL